MVNPPGSSLWCDLFGSSFMKSPAARPILLVLLVAFCLRLIAGWVWQARLESPFGFGDSLSYWELAGDLAHGAPYQYGGEWIFRTPGYPILLAPIFWIAGPEASPLWGRALSAALGTLAVAGVWWLAGRLLNPRAAMIAAVVAALYPGAIVTSGLVLSEAPFCPLMLAHLGLWIAAWQASTPRLAGLLAFAGGLLGATATLVRPSWLLFTPFALVVTLAIVRARWRNLAIGTAMLLGLAAGMLPWWIRNAQLTGRFVATTLQVGASLYDGLSPRATGASNMEFVGKFFEEEMRETGNLPDAYPAAFEYRLDRRLRAAAVEWAKDNPGRVAELAAIKLIRMWNVWPNEPNLSSWPVRIVVLVSYLPVLILGVMGAVRATRGGLPYVLCWLPAVYFTLLHMVFVSSIRYRQPAMLGLIVLAAGVLAELVGKPEPGREAEGERRMEANRC